MNLGQNGVYQDPEEADFWGKVDEFKGKADEFYSLWQRLREKRQLAASDPQLQKEWNDLMGEAEGVTAKVSSVESAIQSAKSWAGGFFGIETVRDSVNSLGALPFLLVAVITGAITWLGTWLGKGYMLDRKLDSVESLVEQGYSPERAGSVVNAEQGTFLSELGGGLGQGIAIAGVAALLLYFFFEKKRGF